MTLWINILSFICTLSKFWQIRLFSWSLNQSILHYNMYNPQVSFCGIDQIISYKENFFVPKIMNILFFLICKILCSLPEFPFLIYILTNDSSKKIYPTKHYFFYVKFICIYQSPYILGVPSRPSMSFTSVVRETKAVRACAYKTNVHNSTFIE